MPGIHAVLFDLDGTLRHSQPSGFETFLEYLAELGYALTPEQARAGRRWTHYYWSISPDLRLDLDECGGETGAFWTRHAERQLRAMRIAGDLPSLAEKLNKLFDGRYQPRHHIPADVIPTLAHLLASGYIVGLVSNRRDPLGALVAELGLSGLFGFTLSAGQAASRKPDPGIFRQAVALAGCPAESAVYVGDNYYADVEGARAAGLRPILVDPHDVFPDPGCPVIRTLGELKDVLSQA